MISFRGYHGSAYTGTKAALTGYASENWNATANGTHVTIRITPNGSTTLTEAMRITNAGYVGIGVTVPGALFHVKGSVAATIQSIFQGATSQSANITEWRNAAGSVLSSVNKDGWIGSGTSNPVAPLHVVRQDEVPTYLDAYSNANYPAGMVGRRARGSIASPAAPQSGDYLTGLFGRGFDGSAFTTGSKGAILIVAAQTWSSVANGTYISFETTPIGSTTRSEVMRIDNAGNMGIGESAPDYKLDVNGTFGFTPGASVTPADNGDVVIEATNNTTLTFKLKGSDGTVRSGTITLA